MTQPAARSIVVAGDLTIDWNVARARTWMGGASSNLENWSAESRTHISHQPGGVWLVADLIAAVLRRLDGGRAAEERGFRLLHPPKPDQGVTGEDKRFTHSYAMWSPYPAKPRADAWRITEFMSYTRARPNDPGQPQGWNEVQGDDPDAALVVLDDADLGIRNAEALWPKAIRPGSGRRPRILLKMAKPVAVGKLWDNLMRDHGDRLVVVMTADDLRRTVVHISRGLSWEQTTQDLVWELAHNPNVVAFSRCAATVVSFGASGAVLLENAKKSRRLFFDRDFHEGDWEGRFHGKMVGYTTCLAAALARELVEETPDLGRGITSGINAIRRLHERGFGPADPEDPEIKIAFPFEEAADSIVKPEKRLFEVEVPEPQASPAGESAGDSWTILESRVGNDLRSIAHEIVLRGVEAVLPDVPLGRFGKLTTVDRGEIEAYRSVSNLLRQYDMKEEPRPLSVAVFGPPGAGKSFGIKQLARALLKERLVELEFNLSQFGGPDDLIAAFHQIRDVALDRSKFPLVFWDEFDTSLGAVPLGWLRYFLAPMQDGKFQEGQVTHPIGRCMFVFAGGTSKRMEEFRRGGGVDAEKWKFAKGRDFVSRLRGFVDILGPNPTDLPDDEFGSGPPESGRRHGPSRDRFFVIRRAILLRSMLENRAAQITADGKARIDEGVRRAFIETVRFRHGARSMESIVAMSGLADKSQYERSCLPAEDQLELHVNARDFMGLAQQIELNEELLDRLGSIVHQRFCDRLRAKGYVYAPKTNHKAKPPEHSSLMPWEKLPEGEREQNRDQVRSFCDKLREIGYTMRPATAKAEPFRPTKEEVEMLAEAEHDRWWRLKRSQGWTYGEPTDKDRMIHQDMKPYAQLSEESKDWDRNVVRDIPEVLAHAGYVVTRAQPAS